MSLLNQTIREALRKTLGGRDYAEGLAVSVPADGEAVVVSLDAPGADRLIGQVWADGGYHVRADWLQEDAETVMRSERLADGVSGGVWTDVDVPVRTTPVELVVEDAGTQAGDLTAEATAAMTPR